MPVLKKANESGIDFNIQLIGRQQFPIGWMSMVRDCQQIIPEQFLVLLFQQIPWKQVLHMEDAL